MEKIVDLTGKHFGELMVLKRSFKKGNAIYWTCQCSCGNIKDIAGKHLKSGGTKSCGCKQQEHSHFIHGMTNSRIYSIWQHMKDRCGKKWDKRYKNYGGRGISVCKEWQNSFLAFYNWAFANGYKDNLSIDRIDVNGNYEPSNCRWITMAEQAGNTTRSVFITHCGESHTKAEWSRIIGITVGCFAARYKRHGNVDLIFQKRM